MAAASVTPEAGAVGNNMDFASAGVRMNSGAPVQGAPAVAAPSTPLMACFRYLPQEPLAAEGDHCGFQILG